MNAIWQCRPFEALSALQWHHMLTLRARVFVVEQNCVYQDPDHKDPLSYHLWGADNNGNVVAYARIVKPGVSYQEVSIGRIIVAPEYRGSGMGVELMEEAFKFIRQFYGELPIRISAQCYLEKFYTNLGFETVSETYLEDDIPHVEMLRTKQPPKP